MAGDWIKMRTDLSEDPAVIAIADRLGIDEFSVVGRLHRIWSWADSQLRDGRAYGVTTQWIDRFVHLEGFSDALIDVGWLGKIENETEIDREGIGLIADNGNLIDREGFEKVLGKIEKGLYFPNFDRHNGQTAKTRAVDQKRKRDMRNSDEKQQLLDSSFIDADETRTREEKRREEKNNPKEAFSIFWKAYPRKDSKVQAERAFSKVAPSPELLDSILDAIERFRQSDQWRRDGGKFIPYASTWLNGRRWEDGEGDSEAVVFNPFPLAL